jgi:hypothetical protein
MFRTRILVALVATAFAGSLTALAAGNSLRSAAPARAPAPAPAPARMATFLFSGMQYSFPLPDGFCIPAGRYAEHARRTADGDATNVTSLSFSDCASMARNGALMRWGMIKTPRSLASTDVGTRQSVIAELKGQFASGEFERSMNQGMSNASPDGVTTKVAPLGTDPNGAYVGGTLSLNGRIFAAAWGMTAVKRRLLAVYIYIPYNSQADVQAVINMVRTATARMVAANGGN